MESNEAFISFSWNHFFGTDALGRDIFLRSIQGAGLSILIVILGVVLSLIAAVLCLGIRTQLKRFQNKGVTLVGNALDMVLESINAVPHFLMMMILGYGFFKTHEAGNLFFQIFLVSLTLSAAFFPQLYLWLRGQEIQFQAEEFITSSKALGATPLQIYKTHFLSWIRSALLRKIYFFAGTLIVAEGSLSFLGLSISSPHPTLGALLRDGWRGALYHPHLLAGPATLLLVLVSLVRFSED